MSLLRVAPIVEGHGEVQCIRTLLQRIWMELLGGGHLEVLQPIRQPRSQLVHEQELNRAIRLAMLKLGQGPPAETERRLVLVLLDADKDPPCRLGPELLNLALKQHAGANIACVLAKIEYETWFAAAAESLQDFLDVKPEELQHSPEDARLGKGWVIRHFRGTKYSETIDQPRMTARMDLGLCRSRSPSFDKLCRELEKQISAPGTT